MHSRSIVVAICLGLVVSACGSDEASDQPPSASDVVRAPAPSPTDDSGSVIGTGNLGGTVVDPQPYPIDGIDIAESFPEQLMVRFTSGDPNCTAATATATASGDTVLVSLAVGITEDALAKSCVADEFEQVVSIGLDEGLDGRQVVAADG